MEAQLEQNEWQVLGHRADHLETDPSSSSTGKVYSEFHICIMVGRYPQWYIGNVLSFVFGLGILGFGLLALPIEKVPHPLEISCLLLSISDLFLAVSVSPSLIRLASASGRGALRECNVRAPFDSSYQVCRQRARPTSALPIAF